jgi:hypothetical protein
VRPAEFYSAAMQSEKQRGESSLGAQATGLCSDYAQSQCLIVIGYQLQALCLLASNLAPDNVFVISPVNKSVDFSVLIITKQNSPLDTFAEEKLGCFRK